MRAFLFYVDDWLSSKQIAQMDAHEEVGYLHLLLAEVTEPDCGLPTGQNELAMLSGLGQQWFRPTKEKYKRIEGLTSGQKILKSFTKREGRYFNQRLLKEWLHQKEVNEKRRLSGTMGGRPRKPIDNQTVSTLEPYGIAIDNQTVSTLEPYGIANVNQTAKQTKTNDVCASVCVSGSEEPKSPPLLDDFQSFCVVAAQAGMSAAPGDIDDARIVWRGLDFESRLAAVKDIPRRLAIGEYENPKYIPAPAKYLKGRLWFRPDRPSETTKIDHSGDYPEMNWKKGIA